MLIFRFLINLLIFCINLKVLKDPQCKSQSISQAKKVGNEPIHNNSNSLGSAFVESWKLMNFDDYFKFLITIKGDGNTMKSAHFMTTFQASGIHSLQLEKVMEKCL